MTTFMTAAATTSNFRERTSGDMLTRSAITASAKRPMLTGSSRHTLRALCSVVLLLLVCFLPVGASGAEVGQLRFGINMLSEPGDAASLRARFRKARAVGVTEVRLDWEWRKAEARRGTYDWRYFDTLVGVAHEEGISLLPIIHYAPAWALTGTAKPHGIYEMAPRTEAFEDFARFVLASIRRYGPDGQAPVPFAPIRFWQIWNEPNMAEFWGPKPDPKGFVRMMQQVRATLAPVRHKVKLVHAGLSKSDIGFVWKLWDVDPKYGDVFDVFAVHPYLFDWNDGIRSPDAMDSDDTEAAAMGFVGSLDDSGYLGKVFNLQLFMNLRGVKDKPIWITEMGYFVAKHRLGVSEAEQASRLVETLSFIRQRLTTRSFGEGARALPANVQRVYWFSLEDYPSPDGLGSFGVYRPDGTLRPAGEAFRKFLY